MGGFLTVKTSGLDDVVKEFEKLADPKECEAVFKAVCYEGMKVMADCMKSQINALKTTKQTKTNKNEKRYCSEKEKAVLLKEMGVSPIRGDGDGYDAKVGFDGYYENSKGKQVAVQILANSVNHGTSFMHAQRFIDRTKRSGQSRSLEAMGDALDREIAKRTK